MTSCSGTSSVSTRSETRIMMSIGKKMSTSPGPFATGSMRPRRRTTPRSHSLTTLMHLSSHIRKRKTPIAITTRSAFIAASVRVPRASARPLLRNGRTVTQLVCESAGNRSACADWFNRESQAIDAADADARSFGNRLARSGAPKFTVYENHALCSDRLDGLDEFAFGADELLASG